MKLTQSQIDRIRSLEDASGRVTPDQVVDDAMDRKSPLHPLFEWDKGKAARAHWVAQAREVIGSVLYTHTTSTTTVKVASYLRDPSAIGQGYRAVTALQRDPAEASRSLIYTLEVASGHVRRALDLAEPLGLSGDVDELLVRIVGLQRAAEAKAA